MATSKRSSSSGNSAGSHLIGWLNHDAQYGNVLATAQLHLKIKHAIEEVTPQAIRGYFDVIKIETGTLTLTVASAAYAAKFRQLAPTVTRHLNQKGWNFSDIKLKVQGAAPRNVSSKAPRVARILDKTDIKVFEELQGQLKPGPLADSVARLIAHHTKTGKT